MQAIRQIHHITSNSLTIPLPSTFYDQEVEVILLPLSTIPKRTSGKQLTQVLETLSKRGAAFSRVKDVVAWQKKQRADRKLSRPR